MDITSARYRSKEPFLAQAVVVLDGVAGIAVMQPRPTGEIGRQLATFVLQALLLGGELKIHSQASLIDTSLSYATSCGERRAVAPTSACAARPRANSVGLVQRRMAGVPVGDRLERVPSSK